MAPQHTEPIPVWIYPVAKSGVDGLFAYHAKELTKAVSGTPETSVDFLRYQVMNGTLQCWRVMSIGAIDGDTDAAAWDHDHKRDVALCLTTLRDAPRPVLDLTFLVGRHADVWLEDLLLRLAQYARYNGCHWLTATGRKGWKRKLHGQFLQFDRNLEFTRWEL